MFEQDIPVLIFRRQREPRKFHRDGTMGNRVHDRELWFWPSSQDKRLYAFDCGDVYVGIRGLLPPNLAATSGFDKLLDYCVVVWFSFKIDRHLLVSNPSGVMDCENSIQAFIDFRDANLNA